MLLRGTPLIHHPPPHHRHHPPLLTTNTLKPPPPTTRISPTKLLLTSTATTVAAIILFSTTTMPSTAAAAELRTPPPDAAETLSNIPQMLSGDCVQGQDGDCKKARIQKPKSRKAESCTIKCVTTCIRGGDGSPGEGPFNVRRPLVVFKQGFRSRHYCLVECSDICNLIRDGDDGP
ncbi:hypothetical protein HanRHA438_Chr03g0123221 [Helianthus annuus]|uniref:Uncharacterized protein n=1 Tax=Helianthus annuus TaxID=4232 RepID=A0A251V767_HELAN|nr:uncharacterized protein LOC110929371 [Helianthus annuus]KAF5814444.1 hypothetical protein HanXRQr2_Chr03g0111111 [Helianthus annuus]KAJ0593059.1 hypothetical protein HanHA300_Chr03g0092791 [Helianthus annuus]KAJ0600826.1 hypothetical protein HanIR_Chr03g0121501 [Helianthus annuus]KAJ0608072.1 hypothetical protein HanHA89_Chr03g0104511 [Helianthus annuus]KAJ0768137.1 hypothetical protein HanLR1_Chr03g0097881 [Helianthus annuus]